MLPDPQAPAPSLLWRAGSVVVMGLSGAVCRVFLMGANRLEVNGLEGFTKLLDERADVDGRQRGLLTVSNHLSVLDDPLMWGVLPLRYLFSPNSMRWALGSHDIVFKNQFLSTFFSLGQVLPTHRLAHSPHGGLFQPTITQTIRLLSRGPFTAPSTSALVPSSDLPLDHPPPSTPPLNHPNPFTDAQLTYTIPSTSGSPNPYLTYTTTSHDRFPAPSAYATRHHAWVHVYPEGRTHQRADHTMRYFKWGVSRLILESEPAPALVPLWIEGYDQVMHESREWPRFVPRVGKDISVTFGEAVDTGVGVFGELRGRWRRLVEREEEAGRAWAESVAGVAEVGVLRGEALRYGEEAVRLREECTIQVREAVLKVRRQRGLPDEDPKVGRMETWRIEGDTGKRKGQMDDGSWVSDT